MSAQLNVGFCYITGSGVKQNDANAVKWFTKSAEQGSEFAQLNLGICYEAGRGVEPDTDIALEWYQKAAEQGNQKALAALDRLG